MKVKDLIAKLQKLNPELLVVLSADSEGNSFNPLSGVDDNSKYADGEVGFAELTDELRKNGYTEEDAAKGEPCVVLWP